MESFQHSELILHPDGSMYHLGLLPGQIADTVIMVGDPERVTAVSRHFSSIEHRVQKREFITHTGYIQGKRVTVISSGIGTDNIDIVLNELHLLVNYDLEKKEFKPERHALNIIRIGTSGCIQPDIEVDSVLISSMAVGIDNLLHFYNYIPSAAETALLAKFKMHCYFNYAIHPYVASASTDLATLFNEKNYLKGITLTAPGFYAPQGREINAAVSMKKFYEDIRSFTYEGLFITNIEMETAGIYGLANLLGHRAVSCNALLANRSNGSFSKDPAKTINNLIGKVLTEILPAL